MLKRYLGSLKLQIVILLQQDVLLRYKRLEARILSLNLPSALFNSKKIADELSDNFVAWLISQILSSSLFVCFPLRLVLISEGKFKKIPHLFFSPSSSLIQKLYSEKYRHLHYQTPDNIRQKVIAT